MAGHCKSVVHDPERHLAPVNYRIAIGSPLAGVTSRQGLPPGPRARSLRRTAVIGCCGRSGEQGVL